MFELHGICESPIPSYQFCQNFVVSMIIIIILNQLFAV